MAFQAVPKCIPSMLVAELEGQSPRALPLFATHPRHPAKQNRAADYHRAVQRILAPCPPTDGLAVASSYVIPNVARVCSSMVAVTYKP
jgi:hypothetical protein